MFDHVSLRVSDFAATKRFLTTVLAPLELGAPTGGAGFLMWRDFTISQATEDRPVTRRLHVGLVARSHEQVRAFWQAGVDAGYENDGEPALRHYSPGYFGSFLLDPDGNSIEAYYDDELRKDGVVDHVWMRVHDVRAARDFYALAGPHGTFEVVHDSGDLVRLRASDGATLTVLGGEPTAAAHFAFVASSPTAVDAFHAELVAAGHRDNGAPGPRPAYGDGYYAAFVLDPDGNNIELVHHG